MIRFVFTLLRNTKEERVPTSFFAGNQTELHGDLPSMVSEPSGMCWNTPGSCAALVSGLLFVEIGVRTGRGWCGPGLESPGVQAPEESSVSCRVWGSLGTDPGRRGNLLSPHHIKVVAVLQAGSVIPWQQRLSPVPETSSIVVKVVGALGQGSLVPTTPYLLVSSG